MSMPSPSSIRGEGKTRQIPREEWDDFLTRFTEFNEETTVRVELVGNEAVGTEILAEDVPLLTVSLDDEAGEPMIIIDCGDTVGATPASFRHIVHQPTAIWARETEPVGWDALEIESAEEGTVILTVNPHPGRDRISFEEAGRSELHV